MRLHRWDNNICVCGCIRRLSPFGTHTYIMDGVEYDHSPKCTRKPKERTKESIDAYQAEYRERKRKEMFERVMVKKEPVTLVTSSETNPPQRLSNIG